MLHRYVTGEGFGVTKKPRVFFIFLVIFLSICFFGYGGYRNWPYKIESDGKYYYQYIVSMVYDFDVDFSNNYSEKKRKWMRTEIDHYKLSEHANAITGKVVNYFTIGPSILWFPFFILAYGIVHLGDALGLQVDMSPWGKVFQYTTMYSAVFYTVIALYLLMRLLESFFKESTSLITIWLMLVSTSLFYYTVFEPSMSHVYDLFTYVMLLMVGLECMRDPRAGIFILFGLSAALHVLVRTQNIASVVVFTIYMVSILVVDRRQNLLRYILMYALTLILGIMPLFLVNLYLYGELLALPQGAGFLNLTNPKIVQVLFSYRNGLFSTHPILLVGCMGLIGLVWELVRKREFRKVSLLTVMVAIFLLQTYINSITSDWWAGHAFGQRRLLSSLPIFALGLAYIIERLAAWRKSVVYIGVAVFSVAGMYLTYIHVFLWDYDAPHDIFQWLIIYPIRNFSVYSNALFDA